MFKLMCKKIIKKITQINLDLDLIWIYAYYPFNSNSWNKDLWHVRIQKVCQRGPTLTTFFLVDGMERGSKCHLKWAIIGPPAKRYLNGVLLAG